MPSPIPRVLLWKERFIPSPKDEQEHDGEGAPGDGQHGEGDALALARGVVREEPQHHGELGAEQSSCELQGDHGVEQRGPARGEVAGHEADEAQEHRGGEDHHGRGLGRAHVLVELRAGGRPRGCRG